MYIIIMSFRLTVWKTYCYSTVSSCVLLLCLSDLQSERHIVILLFPCVLLFFFFFFYFIFFCHGFCYDNSKTKSRINFKLHRVIVHDGFNMPIDFDVDDVMRDQTLAPDWLNGCDTITRERFTAGTSNLVYRFIQPISGSLLILRKIVSQDFPETGYEKSGLFRKMKFSYFWSYWVQTWYI